MGNHKFKLSDMMPNAWFYKLKDMGRSSKNQSISHLMKTSHHRRAGAPTTPKPSQAPHPPTPKQTFLPNRASYYYSRRTEKEKPPNPLIHPKDSDTHFSIDSPRKSKTSTRKPHNPSIKLVTSSATDIIMDIGSDSSFVSELQLPPILTKPVKKETGLATFDERNEATKKESNHKVISTPKEQNKTPTMRSPAGLHRIRMRASSPRIASKKIQACRARRSFGSAKAAQRKGLSGSFAVMKLSSDPRRDFRDSMVEMIVENNIRASKDLEELLACYLALNSNEYHDVIVEVFEQIWCDLTDIIKLQVS